MLFRMRILKILFIIMILEELISITMDLCHLNLWLRSQSHYLFLGPPLVMAVAKYHLHIFMDHLIKANHLTCKPLMGSSIMGSLIQGNLEVHKENPFRDNLWPLMIHLLSILRNLLVIWDNLTCNKANLVSSKVILLGKLVNLTFSKTNQLSSSLSHPFYQDNPQLCKNNPTPSKLNLLGRWVNLNFNWVNLLARWFNLNSLKDILLGLLNQALK